MLHDVWPLVSAEAMRALDRHTIEALGIPGELLMECAGRVVVAEVLRARRGGEPVWVVCGAGNNGGDGLVVARHLHLMGVPVRLVLVSDPQRLRGDPAANWARARAVGVPVAGSSERPEPGAVVVDAIFGTGLARPVEGAAAEAVAWIRASRPGCRVVAVDLPSGLDADTGQVLGDAVRADCTVTLGLPKLGLALEPGRSLAGRIVVGRIGSADAAPCVSASAELWTRAAAGRQLPERPAHGHKGSFGHVLVAAGSQGKSGAAALAAAGAGRAGAGLVTIACAEGLNAILEIKCTEAMTAPLPETAGHALGAAAERPLLELAEARDAVALGPGLGRAEETLALVRRVAAKIERPLVLDADAILAFADGPVALARRPGATILTPHPGEAAALLGRPSAALNADRPAAARELAERTGCVVILKGAATVTAEAGGGRLAVNPTGGPWLATGGTGDVLTGMVAGLLAQGVAPFEAAALAVFAHGLAADRAAAARGPAGLLAGDVADALPAALESLRRAAAAGSRVGSGDALAFPE
jgi:ADP-dependent NAD(P)H-hydrate dehydratase / NAD(P)H-hydrate epimerase